MYSVRYRPQVATLALQRWCCSLAFPVGERSWRTRRMARHKRNVSDLPYAASPFYCAAFFIKEQGAVLRYGTEKGKEAFQYRVGYSARKVRMNFFSSFIHHVQQFGDEVGQADKPLDGFISLASIFRNSFNGQLRLLDNLSRS